MKVRAANRARKKKSRWKTLRCETLLPPNFTPPHFLMDPLVYELKSEANSFRQTRELAKAVSSKVLAHEVAKNVGSVTKWQSYQERFLYDLKCLFEGKTPHPYRYMAGIVNLFNLHPEGFCKACPSLDKDLLLCKRKKIFTCRPGHQKARDKIRKKMDRIGKKIPSAKFPGPFPS